MSGLILAKAKNPRPLGRGAFQGDPFPHTEHGLPNPHIVRTILDRYAERSGMTIAMPRALRPIRRCFAHPDGPTTGGSFAGVPARCAICNSDLPIVGYRDILNPEHS